MANYQDNISYKPLYLQLRDIILQKIVNEEYPKNKLLPSEAMLAKNFGTSISTVRQALSILAADGILEKKQGTGTFIKEQITELSFLSWIPETKQGENLLYELVEKFEHKNLSVKIKIIPTEYTRTKEILLKLISNGDAPDVAQIVSHWTSFFASMGAFEPLENFLAKDNLENRFEDKDLMGGIYQDSVFSVSWGLCPLSLIANKNVLAEAGIEEFLTPMTLDIFSNICKKISDHYIDKDKYSYGLNILHDETDFLRIYTFLQAYNGGFINDKEEVIFNSKENISAFSWLREFIKSVKILDTDIYEIRKRFARNEVAFITDGPWIKYQMEELTGEPFDKNFKVVLNPVLSNKPSLSWNYNHSLAICSQSTKKLHAAKFIDDITSDIELCNFYFQKTGHLPVNRNSFDDPVFNSNFFRGFKEQLNNSKCLNSKNPMFEKAMVLCMDAVRKLLFTEVDIKAELDEKEYYLKMLYYDTVD